MTPYDPVRATLSTWVPARLFSNRDVSIYTVYFLKDQTFLSPQYEPGTVLSSLQVLIDFIFLVTLGVRTYSTGDETETHVA